ncbi:MAG TPA: DNA repair protein RecO [Candidatus Udaeobacter sp.]|nr:DNA repair protein RecO [Candidatus Udaeobacter sp.]
MLAVVLARKNWREFDQMISLYTQQQGKIEVLAKGIKKIISKNSSNLEILSLVEAEFAQGKEIDYLTKVQPVKIFKNIYSYADKMFIASFVVKIIDTNTLPQEKDENIFNLLLSFLEFLNSAAAVNPLNLAIGFIFKFWQCLGFGTEQADKDIWLRGNWLEINELPQTKNEQLKTYEFAKNFAVANGGKILTDWSIVNKIFDF